MIFHLIFYLKYFSDPHAYQSLEWPFQIPGGMTAAIASSTTTSMAVLSTANRNCGRFFYASPDPNTANASVCSTYFIPKILFYKLVNEFTNEFLGSFGL
jgi:hypothetical protein